MTQRIYTLLLYMPLAASLPAWSRDVFLGNDSESNVGKIVEIEVGAEPLTLYDGSTATSKPPLSARRRPCLPSYAQSSS